MSCHECQEVARSSKANPFVPPGGDANALMFVCRQCGTRWHQFNDYYHLWQETPAGSRLVITETAVVVVCPGDEGPAFSD